MRISPQPGPQTKFLTSGAEIAIYGGAAGGGKTFGLLLSPLRYIGNPGYKAVLFRRTMPEIRFAGGLWDEAETLYPLLNAVGTRHNLRWQFPAGATVTMSHLEDKKDLLRWGGSQIAEILFDELITFTESQFWFMLSRNRSACGVRPRIRATCNPDPDSWVRKLIDWWIDPDTGLPIMERAGKIRYFKRDGNDLKWSDSAEELTETVAGKVIRPKSLTFIPASVFDNPKLIEADPGYLANLKSLPLVERERLLGGNWNIRAIRGTMFRAEWFRWLDMIPAMHRTTVRYWDRAATVPEDGGEPDWTVGLKVSRMSDENFLIEHMVRLQGRPGEVHDAMRNTAAMDGPSVTQVLEQDPGQAGVVEMDQLTKVLAGYTLKVVAPTGDKITRAGPASSQAEHGHISILRGHWNKSLIDELEAFPEGRNDDVVDALSGSIGALLSMSSGAQKVQRQHANGRARNIDVRHYRPLPG